MMLICQQKNHSGKNPFEIIQKNEFNCLKRIFFSECSRNIPAQFESQITNIFCLIHISGWCALDSMQLVENYPEQITFKIFDRFAHETMYILEISIFSLCISDLPKFSTTLIVYVNSIYYLCIGFTEVVENFGRSEDDMIL